MDNVEHLLYVLCLMEDLHVVTEADAEEFVSQIFGRHWRPFCERECVDLYFARHGEHFSVTVKSVVTADRFMYCDQYSAKVRIFLMLSEENPR